MLCYVQISTFTVCRPVSKYTNSELLTCNRSQFARIGDSKFPVTLCCTGVPQVSLLGPSALPFIYIANRSHRQLIWYTAAAVSFLVLPSVLVFSQI